MADAKRCGFEDYSDNWLFALSERGAPQKIAQLNFLGVTAYAIVQEERHKTSGKSWLCYEIVDASLDSTLAVCGYKFQSEGR